jgi:hypothetical protein
MTDEPRNALVDRFMTKIIVLSSVAGGLLLLTLAYYTDKTSPFLSFMLLQFGGLLVFSAGYAAVSDRLVRKNFEELVRATINVVGLDQSIKNSGLVKWVDRFNQGDLEESLSNSSSLLMLVLRSDHFFDSAGDGLRARMQRGELKLLVMLPNPLNRALMLLMAKKFSNLDGPEDLARSIQKVINVWLRAKIYSKLAGGAQKNLTVKLMDKYPLYSAYQFDQRELWYIPYHYRDNHQPTPVLVFGSGFERATAIYQDLEALKDESPVYDLSQDLKIPDGYFAGTAALEKSNQNTA